MAHLSIITHPNSRKSRVQFELFDVKSLSKFLQQYSRNKYFVGKAQ